MCAKSPDAVLNVEDFKDVSSPHYDTGVGFLSLLLLQSSWQNPTVPWYSLWEYCLFQQRGTLNQLHMCCHVRMNFGMLLQGWSYFQIIWYLNAEQVVWIAWVIQKTAAASSIGARTGSSSLNSYAETKSSINSWVLTSSSLCCEGWLVWAALHSWMTQAKPLQGVSSLWIFHQTRCCYFCCKDRVLYSSLSHLISPQATWGFSLVSAAGSEFYS